MLRERHRFTSADCWYHPTLRWASSASRAAVQINAELDSQSPFALLLVGQPTLGHQLRLGVFAALDQRIATRYQLAPMDLPESAQYLRHHLALGAPIRIEPAALEALSNAALQERAPGIDWV